MVLLTQLAICSGVLMLQPFLLNHEFLLRLSVSARFGYLGGAHDIILWHTILFLATSVLVESRNDGEVSTQYVENTRVTHRFLVRRHLVL